MKSLVKAILSPLKPLEQHAPAFLQDWGRGLVTNTEIDPKPFNGFSHTIRPRMMKVASTRFYSYSEQARIPGWLSPKERQLLYALGRWMPGPIVEFGSWCGLSTTAIARGIKDSGEQKDFETYDLILTEEMFRPMPDGTIGMFLPGDDAPHGTSSRESYEREIRPIISASGGSSGVLKQGLDRLGLLDKVEIFRGDFRTFQPRPAKVVFCDCLHDEHEIEQNAPALRPWLQSGSILASHDIGQIPELVTKLRRHISLGHGVSVDSIYLAEVV